MLEKQPHQMGSLHSGQHSFLETSVLRDKDRTTRGQRTDGLESSKMMRSRWFLSVLLRTYDIRQIKRNSPSPPWMLYFFKYSAIEPLGYIVQPDSTSESHLYLSTPFSQITFARRTEIWKILHWQLSATQPMSRNGLSSWCTPLLLGSRRSKAKQHVTRRYHTAMYTLLRDALGAKH